MTTPSNLSPLQTHIYEYVEQHPGKLKEDLVNDLVARELASRKTIYKNLVQLIPDYIVVSKEKANSQRHPLFINCSSELRSAIDEIVQLRDSFIKLIQEVKEASNAVEDFEHREDLHYSPAEAHMIEPVNDLFLAHASLRTLFQHMLAIFMLYFLFEWPQKIPDEKSLDKLYSITFQVVKEIRTQISKSLRGYKEFKPNLLRQGLVDNLFILTHKKLEAAVMNLEIVGLKEETVSVVDALWKFSLPFPPGCNGLTDTGCGITEGNFEKTDLIKDWKTLVKNLDDVDDIDSARYGIW